MTMKNIYILTEAGGDVGLGHVVWMGHLYYILKQRGHSVSIQTNPAGQDYFISKGIPSSVSKEKYNIPSRNPTLGLILTADIVIVDFMNNDDSYLALLRPHTKKLVVIVGVGWTITPTTRWIADLVVYHTVEDNDLYGWTPGEKVLQGLENVMLDPNFADVVTDNERQYDLAIYFGGGLHDRIVEALVQRIDESEYKTFYMGYRDSQWDHSPYDTLVNAKLYIGSMGMMAYEAIIARAYPMVFCRSEDHMESADRLDKMDLLTNFGMTGRPTKQNSVDNIMAWIETRYDKINSRPWKPLSIHNNLLDGKGIYRVALEILKDA